MGHRIKTLQEPIPNELKQWYLAKIQSLHSQLAAAEERLVELEEELITQSVDYEDLVTELLAF